MDKDTRNSIERATQRARKLLEEDFAARLEGGFDVHRDGKIAAKAGTHLSARQAFQRERIIGAIEHKCAAGMNAPDAVADYLRDAAFTTLNRFAALKMLEARELVQECITKGEQSSGYREFCGMAPGLPLLPESAGYKLYLESLFDELSTEVKVLFDRRDPASVLWPKRTTFEQLLEILNATDLANVWSEDETIGWVYQFFNGQDERKKMREESQAPRNSRELAVRNQFFTPRYVVQFLTDNTLGRIWYEMRGTNTSLADKCEYMVRKPGEEFAPRAKKDPRDLRVLDPACGSGHFLLYAFDLLLAIYEEAYADPASPKSEVTGKTLAEDYPSQNSLRKALPGLVLSHNLHGVDIDPRCAQIAQLALWMRAQKAYREFGIDRADRAQIRRSNIVVAEPLVADELIAKEFVAKLHDDGLRRVFTGLIGALRLAGELGVLVRIESLVTPATKHGQTSDLLAPTEHLIRSALARFISEEGDRGNMRRRLFADDAVQGIGLISLLEKKHDVILMNPPFGAAPSPAKVYIDKHYVDGRQDLFAVFVVRAAEHLHSRGRIGYLGPRTVYFAQRLGAWRRRALIEQTQLVCLADLGLGVLDSALVDVAAGVLEQGGCTGCAHTLDALGATPERKGPKIRELLATREWKTISPHAFLGVPGCKFLFGAPTGVIEAFKLPKLDPSKAIVREGPHTADNVRFVRLWWEVAPVNDAWGEDWPYYAKGGEYSPFWSSPHLLLDWRRRGRDIAEGEHSVLPSKQHYGKPGLTYTERTASIFNARILPSGSVFSQAGPAILPLDPSDALPILAVVMSMPVRAMLEFVVGTGDAGASGGVARHFLAGTVAAVPIPKFSSFEWELLQKAGQKATQASRQMWTTHETTLDFGGIDASWSSLAAGADTALRLRLKLTARVLEASGAAEQLCITKYGLSEVDINACSEVAARNPWAIARRPVSAAELEVFETLDEEPLVDFGAGRIHGRSAIKPSFYADRRVELACRVLTAHPIDVIDAWPAAARRRQRDLAWRTLSVLVGHCLGRWNENVFRRHEEITGCVTGSLEHCRPPEPMRSMADSQGVAIAVDDEGHTQDLVMRVESAVRERWLAPAEHVLTECLAGLDSDSLRSFLLERFFAGHLSEYSESRRQAPIYWQLATPAATYSVWLYIHAFNKDTFFRVQNDYVAPKLTHEERRLESLTGELRDGATAAQRKALAAQETFVEELRVFLEEVKRVAPLWNPNLDDGVSINFAPLWRLVPQHKAWQKELKSTWDALVDGKYDWSHLAMHLWPERVVPKCAKDRSLAIAHGLEDVFWVEGTDSKWTPRKTPTKNVEELVRERTSSAVKAALKSLLEAPTASGKSVGRKSGGRRKAVATAAAQGGNS